MACPLVYEVSQVFKKHWNAYSVSVERFPKVAHPNQNKPLEYGSAPGIS